jgi:hypothetical protein
VELEDDDEDSSPYELETVGGFQLLVGSDHSRLEAEDELDSTATGKEGREIPPAMEDDDELDSTGAGADHEAAATELDELDELDS